jgi:Fic family protein
MAAMKASDLSPVIRSTLVPLPDYPGAQAIVPPPPPLRVPLKGVEEQVLKAHEALAMLQARLASLPNPNLVLRTLDRREAVRSSQIEGTHAGLDHVFEYEATGSGHGLPADVRVTANYVIALDHGLQVVRAAGSSQALTLDLIRKLHELLMEGDEAYRNKDVPGQFRTRQNWIGARSIYDAKIVPPPPDRLDAPLRNLEAGLQYAASAEDQYRVSIIVRMAIMHAYFELVHPFLDGNGRIGRILLPLMLAAEGYPPVYLAGHLKNHQSQYSRALGNAQLQEKWAEWIGFLANGVTVSCVDSVKTAEDLLAIRASWTQRLAHLRRDASALAALDVILGSPVITANKLRDALTVSFPAANTAITQLETADILRPTGKQGRNRAFIAHEVIARLDRS